MLPRRERLSGRALRWAFGALVAAAVLAAFAPALGNGFVFWDDDFYVVKNPWFHSPGGPPPRWMLTTTLGSVRQPLTWLSFALDYRLRGLDPWGFHLTNILLQAAAAVLFYQVCLRLLEDAGAAAFAALFWAIHPLRVESVAWVSERKDVLSGVFLLLALRLRLSAVEHERRGAPWNAGALAAYLCSLAAKPIGATFPVVMLILEVYPLQRLAPQPRRWLEAPARRVLVSLAPFFALAAVSLALNVAAGYENRLFDTAAYAHRPLWRLSQVLYDLAFYPGKTLWPSALACYYPPPAWFGAWSWPLAGLGALVAAAVAAIARAARRLPALAAVACYVVLLAPVSGLVQMGTVFAAFDRYSYFPSLALATLLGAAFLRIPRGARALAAAWLFALGVATRGQCAVWRDEVSLWSAAAARQPSGFALLNWGAALIEAGKADEGLSRLREAFDRYPEPAARWLDDQRAACAAWRRGPPVSPGELLQRDVRRCRAVDRFAAR